jgi:hypothetical protein
METIKIQGRTFRPVVDSTFEHDIYLMNHIRGAGLDTIQPKEGEAYEDFALRLFDGLIGSGRLLLILGGLIIPEEITDLQWSPDVATITADFLKKVSAPEDKVIIEQQVIALLVNFIQTGIIRSRTSLKSLKLEEGPADEKSGALSTSETGEV